MNDFYFFRTKRLVEVLALKEISAQTFIAYSFYLIVLLSIYTWAPYFISPETRGDVSDRHHLTDVLQLLIFIVAICVMFKMSKGHSLSRFLKSYIALYSTEAIVFILVRILFGLIVLYSGVLMGLESDDGFQKSHYPTLISEMTAVCGSEFVIQLLMFYRFYQIRIQKNQVPG